MRGTRGGDAWDEEGRRPGKSSGVRAASPLGGMFREEQFNLPRCSIVRREAVSAVKSAKAVAMGALGRPDLPMAKSRYPTSYRGLTVPILEPENPAQPLTIHHTPSSNFFRRKWYTTGPRKNRCRHSRMRRRALCHCPRGQQK